MFFDGLRSKYLFKTSILYFRNYKSMAVFNLKSAWTIVVIGLLFSTLVTVDAVSGCNFKIVIPLF